jgi:capsular polysaccharide biosynthesis protein/Mrp family chromosome partitioning ATPase
MLSTAPPVLPPYNLSEDHLGPNEPDSIDVDAVIRFIRKSWRPCLIWIFAGLCAGVGFAMLAPAYYTAYTTILLEDRASRAPGELAGGAAAVDQSYADSQIEVLQSDEVVRRVVDRNRLTEVDEFGKDEGGLRSLISRFASPDSPRSAATGPAAEHATLKRVKHSLSIRRLGISYAVEIGFTSRDPLLSAEIANTIAQSYIDNQTDLKRKAFEEAESHLRESLAEIRDKAFANDPPAQHSSPTTPESGEQALARSRELQNSADVYRALYNNLLQRRYAESLGQFSLPVARVISPAEPPTERSWPRTNLVLAIAAACGAAGGLGRALLRHATDHSLRTVEDVQRSTGLGRVTGIPKINRLAWKTAKFRQKALQPAYGKASVRFYDTMGKLVVKLQGGQSHRSGLVIGVVAPMAGAGASSVAAHLARIIAESGQKTLLVDANWRKPLKDTALLQPNPGRKLATGLAIVNLEPESLTVLLLRRTAPITELNASLSIVATLPQLRADYACVVVDFHSAEQTADFEANMTAINEAVVVVEAGRTSAESLKGFLRLIPGNKVTAVVLNKV